MTGQPPTYLVGRPVLSTRAATGGEPGNPSAETSDLMHGACQIDGSSSIHQAGSGASHQTIAASSIDTAVSDKINIDRYDLSGISITALSPGENIVANRSRQAVTQQSP